MARALIFVILLVLYFASSIAVSSHEHVTYEFKIVPRELYPVAKYYDYSLLDYAAKALVIVVSTALAIVKGILVNGFLILIGVALTVSICVYTPYCTLVIEKPFFRDLHRLKITYLDDIEQYVSNAYRKYHTRK